MKSALRVTTHVLILLLVYQALRYFFWWHNSQQFPEVDASALGSLSLQGLRFDLAAIGMSNGLVYALYLLPWPAALSRLKTRVCVLLAFLANGMALSANFVDVEYYKFTGKRLTMDSFAIAQDIGDQLSPLIRYYWQNALFLLLLWILCFYFNRYFFQTQPLARTRLRQALTWLVTVGLLTLALRGGIQVKPLIAAQAFAANGGRSGVIALNSTFTLLKSSQKASIPEVRFFADKEVRSIIDAYRPSERLSVLERRPKNVVLIILESFAAEYVLPSPDRPSYAPFLYSLMQKGSSFPHAFASGRRSIDALPSILASVPAWMEAPFITSLYQTNQVLGLAGLLKSRGMRSAFYHGGKNGTMFFDLMAQRFGFDRYVGMQQYPREGDFDGQWGIFDEPFLQFVKSDLSRREGPFFASVFTLSSHNPYTIPAAYKGRFPKGTLEIHESVGYADYALRQFYEAAQKEAWFADTLFVITADHTSKSDVPRYETPYGRYSVPLVFIQNDHPLPFPDLEQPVEHFDIMPTILDFAGVESQAYSPFGQSLLKPLTRPGVVLYEGETYHLFSREELISWSTDGSYRRYRWMDDPMLRRPLPPTEADRTPQIDFIKAQIQAYNNGMVRNRLIW